MHDSTLMRWLWPLLASLAGAITALASRPFRGLSKGEIAATVFIGWSFSTFVGPLVARAVNGWMGTVDFQVLGTVYYGLAVGAHILLPRFIRKIGKVSAVFDEEDGR